MLIELVMKPNKHEYSTLESMYIWIMDQLTYFPHEGIENFVNQFCKVAQVERVELIFFPFSPFFQHLKSRK